MKTKAVLALIALVFIAILGCTHVSPGPIPLYIRAGYQVSAWSSPCGPGGIYMETQDFANGVYTSHNYCEGGAYSNTFNSSATAFNLMTNSAYYMSVRTEGGAYSNIAIPPTAPAGTIGCHQSADGAHMVCENAAGVITHNEEHPSVHGVLDADGSANLVFYEESRTPF